MKNKKPNCYKCKYRGEVAGSAHSSCNHPKCKTLNENPLINIMSMLGGARGGLPPMDVGLKIKGNPYGIRSGWFNHPFSFDPIWLESCNDYKKK